MHPRAPFHSTVLSRWAVGSMLKLPYGVQLLLMFYVDRNTFKETPPTPFYISLSTWCDVEYKYTLVKY